MRTRWVQMLAEVLLLALLAVGLFSAGIVFPMGGAVLSLLSPLPLAILALRHGRLGLAAGLVLIPLCLAGLGSLWQGLAYLLEFAGPAILLAAGLRRGGRTEPITVGVAALLSLGGLGVLVLSAGEWSQPLAAVQRHVDLLLGEMEGLTARLGVSAEAGAPAPTGAWIRGWLLAAFPGLFFCGNLLAAAGYDGLLRWLARRWPAAVGGVAPGAWRWELPESLVWAFIGSGLLYLTGVGGLTGLGLNGLIVLLGLYFLQGLAILFHLVERFQLPRVATTLAVLVLVVQPLAMLLVASLGLFDVWCGFRRPSLPKSPRGASG